MFSTSASESHGTSVSASEQLFETMSSTSDSESHGTSVSDSEQLFELQVEPVEGGGYQYKPWSGNKFLPQEPFRALYIGPSRSGKSTAMFHLVTRGLLDYDRLWLISPTKFQGMYRKLVEAAKIAPELIITGSSTTDLPTLAEFEEMDPELRKLIIVDDLSSEMENIKANSDLYSLLTTMRHANVSVIFLCHDLVSVERKIRKNISHFAIFRGSIDGTSTGLNTLYGCIGQGMPDKDEFRRFVDAAFSQPYGFIWKDNERLDEYRFRINYSKPWHRDTAR